MKKSLISLLSAAFILSSILVSQEKEVSKNKPVRDGIFIHISSGLENPHRVVMALKLATLMSAEKDVLVYLDIKGIEVVLKEANDVTYPIFPSAQESIKLLLAKGISIYACPSCLKAAGKSGEDLMPGVKIAEKDKFFSFTNGRILSLDY